MTPPIRLAALDMAGTTVSDDGVVERAFREALADVGGGGEGSPVGDAGAFVMRTMGQSKIVVFTELFGGDIGKARRANAAFEAAYDAAVDRGEVGPIPGAEEAMAELRAAGVKVCLTTGFAPATRDRILDTLGWTGSVDLALSPADAGRGRPWPDMILTAVIRLEIEDVRQVAVAGDTVNDLWAGWRAGAGVVAGVLTGAHGRPDFEAVPHTHILSSVADLSGLVLVT
ncbi:MAG TPA: phosphonatase-like hydrolase [Acidimicrobiales bacterium]|nr:phosphonatase-like hydrolase [Acidimicrobiales bacterium]